MKNVALAIVATLYIGLTSGIANADNWPNWRGPTGDGLVAAGNPPISWSEKKNIKWKTAIHGEGSSTPAIWGNRIFLTTAVLTGKSAEAAGGRRRGPSKPTTPYQFNIICLERETGKILWEKTAAEILPHEGKHNTNTFAPNSPVTDGEYVWVSFGSRGLYCYTVDGKFVWSNDLFPMKITSSFGEGSSAVLAGDAIIVLMDHEGDSKILAFNKTNGDLLWEKDRDEGTTWSTPLVIERDGILQVITSGKKTIRSYNAQNGELIWHSPGLEDSAIPTPVVGNGNVYFTSGYLDPKLIAMKMGGTGDLSQATVWQIEKNTPYVSSPLLYGERIYVTRGLSGFISCFNAITGEPYYIREKLEGMRQVYASPIGVADRIYITGRKGTTTVIKNSDEFKILATNILDDGFDGSPVVIGDELYLKGAANLYCIAKD